MKRKITFLLAALLLSCGLSWAQQITWSAGDQGYDNGAVIESVDFDDYVSAQFFKGTNNNAPKYYNTGSAIRCYGGNYFTVTSDYLLTEITLGFASGESTNAITTDCGEYSNGTWTGSANEVTFTIGGTSGHRRIATFAITYTESGTPAPSINASNVEIAYDATSGTIEYTINNPANDGIMTATTDAEWLTFGEEGTDFTCTINEDIARSADVTLTYTYDTVQTATKTVTVTQDANPNVPGTQNNPYTVAQAIAAIDAGVGVNGVYATGIVSAIQTAYNPQYSNITFDIVDATGDEAFVRVYRCGGEEAANVSVGDVAVVYGNLVYYNNSIYEFAQGCQVISLTHPAVPSVTVTPNTINAPAEGAEGTLALAYENITDFISFDYYFCDAEGQELQENPDWIDAEIQNGDETYSLYYVIDANDSEARTAYLKVYTFDDNEEEVYAIVTVNQDAFEVPTYAALPFEFNDGRNDIENTDGLYQEGLGSDYGSQPKLKFDGTGDWLLLQFQEEPGTLTFDIKGNSFSGGTFTVQTSVDGETYTDLAAYTELGATETVTIALNGNVRYIKWIYTEKVSGNVGLGNIALIAPVPAITLEQYAINVEATSGDGMISVVYTNMDELYLNPHVQLYDAEGTPVDPEYYDWISVNIGYLDDNVYYGYDANTTTEARTVYFKVYNDEVYSNMATISQAAYVAPASITVDPDEVVVNAEEHNGTLALAYENLPITEMSDFDIQYYNAEGQEAETPDWIEVLVAEQDPEIGEGYVVSYYMLENEGEARTAYFKVFAMDDETNLVYSNLVTINQDAYVGASITVETTEVNATAAATTGTFNVTGINVDMDYTWVEFCTVDGDYAYYDWVDAEVINDGENYYISYTIEANGGAARTAYFKVGGQDNVFQDLVYSDIVTVNQAASSVTWVLTDFADLMEGDMFVIVGTRTDDAYAGDYALPSSYGGYAAPAAVAINVENNALTTEPDTDLQWFLSFTEDGSYVFYPVIYSYEMWLYCTNTNNGLRVGYGNGNNAFVMEDGYLKNVATSRYIGIYNAQDWRCYQNTTGNIANQTFSFYKKVVEPETYTLDIAGYGENEGGYCLIASPVYVNPETTGMTQGEFDLYRFDQNYGDEWRNYEAQNFNLVPGKGYLYANSQNVTLTFTGTPYSGDGTVKLVNNDNADFAGWNLVGNPFGETAYIDRDYYTMNEDGSGIIAANERNYSVEPMQGIFVIAAYDGEEMTFSTESGAPEESNVVINVTTNRGTIDRAIVRFGEGRQLPKFQLNENSTKLYIPQGNNDYSVVRSAAQNEMPVNFKAAQEGTYTLSVNTENVEMNYLHLIDNMTGADIDLLQTPSYTFESNTNDYSNRFRLVFSANGIADDTTNAEPFAFFNGSEWVVSNIGKATLQMVDLTGRILSSESINGNATVSTSNLSTGIYMLRLVNGENVKTQKMVVK